MRMLTREMMVVTAVASMCVIGLQPNEAEARGGRGYPGVTAKLGQVGSPQQGVDFSGRYQLDHRFISGTLDVCINGAPQRICTEITLALPIEYGAVSVESLVASMAGDVEAAAGLGAAGPWMIQFLEEVLAPRLADALNAELMKLPVSMDLSMDPGIPAFESVLTSDVQVTRSAGQVGLETGEFALAMNLMTGRLATEGESGEAVYELPVNWTFSASTTSPSVTVGGVLTTDTDLSLQ